MNSPVRLTRFTAHKSEPERAYGLAADHPAVLEGRTLFPDRVAPASSAKQFLVSGYNNSKVGKLVLKGPWAGMPIFTLTLEERRTCPASCLQWADCYGNALHWPKRWDHTDADFIDFLRAEIITKCRENPKGLVVRLHVLGDFYSFDYTRMWVEMIDRFPQLHVYGYTARREDDEDEESRRIAAGLRRLSERVWDQFAIRFSSPEPGRQHAIVVDEDPGRDDVIMCPQQPGSSETCGTCGLCWSPNAQDKTIAFLRHGMKRAGAVDGVRPRGRHAKRNEDGMLPAVAALHKAMLAVADPRGVIEKPAREIADLASVSTVNLGRHVKVLGELGYLQVLRRGRGPHAVVYRVFADRQAEFPPAPPLPLPTMPAKVKAPIRDRPEPARAAVPVDVRKPDAPLVRKRFIPSATDASGKVVRPWMIGSADQFDIGTPEERIAALDEDEKQRIAARYGVTFKK